MQLVIIPVIVDLNTAVVVPVYRNSHNQSIPLRIIRKKNLNIWEFSYAAAILCCFSVISYIVVVKLAFSCNFLDNFYLGNVICLAAWHLYLQRFEENLPFRITAEDWHKLGLWSAGRLVGLRLSSDQIPIG